MPVLIIPALDLKGGRVVRLYQGDLARVTAYSPDPVAEARRWVAAGARRLHLVDLDGAAAGYPAHLPTVAAVARSVPVPLQVGGGLRCLAAVEEALAAGARWAVLGSAAVRDPQFLAGCLSRWPGRIMVALDLRRGRVALDAWRQQTEASPRDLARRWASLGAEDLIVTDTERDGTLAGVDIRVWEPFLGLFPRLWVAGGVAGLEDLRLLKKLEPRGLTGVIVGRALYNGCLDLAAALRVVEEGEDGAQKTHHPLPGRPRRPGGERSTLSRPAR